MSETELSVICKNCGSEVSPYVTECPYCGARLRKRAPKLERRGDGLEPMPSRTRSFRIRMPARPSIDAGRPYATMVAILGSAVLILAQAASGATLSGIGGLAIPVDGEWWRCLTAPFAYVDVGYLFVVSLGLAIFAGGVESRLGTAATAILLLACGALGMLAASGIAGARDELTVIAGGNGMALGALAAWYVLRRAESRFAVDEDYDTIGVVVAAAVLLALPIFESSADPFAGVVGGIVGGVAGFAASALRPSQ